MLNADKQLENNYLYSDRLIIIQNRMLYILTRIIEKLIMRKVLFILIVSTISGCSNVQHYDGKGSTTAETNSEKPCKISYRPKHVIRTCQ